MKNFSLLLGVLLMFSFISLSAQKPFAGTIKSTTKIEGSTNPNLLSKYQQSEKEVIVLGSKTKTVIPNIGITFISNSEDETNTIILDMSMYGVYYKTTKVEKSNLMKYEYVADKNDTKTIAGYHAYKVIFTATDLETDETKVTTFYVTDDLIPNYKSMLYLGLEGYPLYIANESEYEGQKITIIEEVTTITPNKKIKAVDFLLPDGAKSFEEAPAELKPVFEKIFDGNK